MGTEQQESESAKWVQLIRRAYDMPDIIVRDDLVRRAVADRVLRRIDPDVVRPADHQKSVVEIGRISDLEAEDADEIRDRFILDAPIPFGGLPNRSDNPLLFAAEEFLGGRTAAPFSLAVAVEVLDTVKEFVQEHKFQADCGCYFDD